MCGRGNLCAYCDCRAIATVHWPSWAANLCGICLAYLMRFKKPDLIVMHEEGDKTCQVVS